jgi:hypothetical protein
MPIKLAAQRSRCYAPAVPPAARARLFISFAGLTLCEAGLLLMAAVSVNAGPAKPSRSTPKSDDHHYLMLVNTARASQLDPLKLAQFDRSPYDALAVSFEDAYGISPVRPTALMKSQIAGWKKATNKTIWPWVYLNRMIGADMEQGNALARVPYFERFQGLDLDDRGGARSDFLVIWRNAFHLAKATGAPGIVCDLEFYNNYKAYEIPELARMTSATREQVLNRLRQLGGEMGEIAGREYPGATIWFLFTGFTRPDFRVAEGKPYYLASTYIVEGLLDEILKNRLPMRVLSGGEVGLGYCHTSVEDLRQAIKKRAATFAPLLQKYDGILELAGTMTLWSDRSAKKNWVANGACGASSASTVEDLIPYMEVLFGTYRYNWIYGSPNGGYLAFQADSAPRFDAAVARARALAYAATAEGPEPQN